MPETKRFICPVAISTDPNRGNVFSVISPKTGHAIEVGEYWTDQLSFHLRGRVAQAVSLHKPASFTHEELSELVALEQKRNAAKEREAQRQRYLRPSRNPWLR